MALPLGEDYALKDKMISDDPAIMDADKLKAISLRAEREKLSEEVIELQAKLDSIEKQLKQFESHGVDGALDELPSQFKTLPARPSTPEAQLKFITVAHAGDGAATDSLKESNGSKDRKSSGSPGFLKSIANKVSKIKKRGSGDHSGGHENDPQPPSASKTETETLVPDHEDVFNRRVITPLTYPGNIPAGLEGFFPDQSKGNVPPTANVGPQAGSGTNTSDPLVDPLRALSVADLGSVTNSGTGRVCEALDTIAAEQKQLGATDGSQKKNGINGSENEDKGINDSENKPETNTDHSNLKQVKNIGGSEQNHAVNGPEEEGMNGSEQKDA